MPLTEEARYGLKTLLKLPWSIAPLEGKYYGTEVLDADDNKVVELWDTEGGMSPPSRRERITREEICDSHYESVKSLAMAEALCEIVNQYAYIDSVGKTGNEDARDC